ncbi:hypothetical protein K458DRAFT_442194 [Lentithecium fluviatile CBS 122367]|uniref:3'-5' exonuclease domain-containing protein n=1 Tax=Lentithecium fluviatile CBS 122367 TaxID=1168545 RepID=A0A6G1J5T3_9PLEO|nr:hypothetical protein K458DRAFT_442194 [Lentithecium fluviatile CBS 122367]
MAITTNFISTTAQLSQMLASLNTASSTPPALYIDLEGIKLSRDGSISILTLYDRTSSTVYLIDVHTLQESAFTTPSTNTATTIASLGDPPPDAVPAPPTLKAILESPTISKVFFDVRNDSDALFSHYGIRLQGIRDLQLMELATRNRPTIRVNGLAACIKYDIYLPPLQQQEATQVKEAGLKLFAPERGGTYQVFNQRPLRPEIEKYCAQDVVHMPRLWQTYNTKLAQKNAFWQWIVSDDTLARIADSQSAGYRPNGQHKAEGWSYQKIQAARLRFNK